MYIPEKCSDVANSSDVANICYNFVVVIKNCHRKSFGSSHVQRASRGTSDESDDVNQSASRTAASLSKSTSCDRSSCISGVEKQKCIKSQTESYSTLASFNKLQPSSRLFQLSLQETIRDSRAEAICGSSSQSEDGSSERRTKRCKLDSCANVKQSRTVSSCTPGEVMEVSMQESSEGDIDAASAVAEKIYYLRNSKDCFELHSCDNSSSLPNTRKMSVAASHKKNKFAAENVTSLDSEIKWNDIDEKGDESKLFALTRKSSTYKHSGNRGKMKTEGHTRKQSNSCGKDANQTNQNSLHSVHDQKLSNNSASRDRGKDDAQGKARSSAENQCHLVPGEVLHCARRSKSSVHTPASWRSSASNMKKKQGDCHRPADGVGPQHHSNESRQMKPEHRVRHRESMPECRGNSGKYSTKTVVDVEDSSSKNSCEEVNIPEDWAAELCIIPSLGCNVTVETDSVVNNVEEACVGESFEVSTYNSCAPVDHGNTASNSSITETLLISTAVSEEEIPDRPQQETETGTDHSVVQDSSVSGSVNMGTDCAGEQTKSETYASVTGVAITDISQKKETSRSCASDKDNLHVYTEYDINAHENDGKQNMSTCDYSVIEGREQRLSVPLPDDLASSNVIPDDAHESEDEYNTSYEVMEPCEFEADNCFPDPSSEKCADEVSSGKQLFHYFASD